MIRKTLSLAAAVAMFATSPANAQSTTQAHLQERYDRALAAGYKALMLCSAIGNAQSLRAERTEASVEQWELAGIQSPLDAIVMEQPYELVETERGLRRVEVSWVENAPPRIAIRGIDRTRTGCSLMPIGMTAETAESFYPQPPRSRPGALITPPFYSEFEDDAFVSEGVMRLARLAIDGSYGDGSRTTAVVVLEDRKLKAERYTQDFGPNVPQRTWSVAKSIAATLFGSAVYSGELEVNAIARVGVEENDPRRAVTYDHLLRMASGRYTATLGSRTDALYYGGGTVEETAGHWPLVAEPGAAFRYANNDTLGASVALPKFHDNGFGFVRSNLRGYGMHSTFAETDWQGDFILSSQVWSTARDLARLGQLYLNNGVTADGTRVLPENWLEYVSTPSGPQPDGPMGYGASWWLMNKSEGIPPDTIAALGNRGQVLVVVPSRDVVIVRRGEDPAGYRFDVIAFTRDVLAALED